MIHRKARGRSGEGCTPSLAGLRAFWLVALAVVLLPACSPQPESGSQGASSAEQAVVADEEAGLFEAPEIDYPEPLAPLGMIDAREQISLNGDWNFIVDPMCGGCLGAPFGSFSENRPGGGMNLVEYDFESAETVRVPGDWNTQQERLFFYRGPAWYYRTFEIDLNDPDTERILLHFGGANFLADVFVNRTLVGRHEGGYVPFSFDITEVLAEGVPEDGKHFVIVRVDNELGDATVPTGRTDWWPYGGLTRDVSLVRLPNAHLRNAKFELLDAGDEGEGASVSVAVTTSGIAQGTAVSIAVDELGIAATATVGTADRATTTFTADLDLWSPDQPRLYDIKLSTPGGDQLTDRVGFRTIETRGHAILLNGKEVTLRGISTHEEPIAETDRDHGVMFERRQARRVLEEAKALGANFVRLAHYPHSRHMAQLADEMGLLLWEEIPVYWNIDWHNPATLAIARDQMARLVERDWNRPSVIIWSFANETPVSPARMRFLEELADTVRERDQTRLLSAALLGDIRKDMETLVPKLAARALLRDDLEPEDRAVYEAVAQAAGDAASADAIITLVVSDPLEELVDVLATNEYYGWYYSVLIAKSLGVSEGSVRRTMLSMMPDMRLTAAANKPLFVSEFGAGATAGTRSKELDIWSEDYQAAVYHAQIAMLEASPQVAGMSPWILKDFHAMLRPLRGIQDYTNRKGLIAPDGQRKLAFDVLREFYTDK